MSPVGLLTDTQFNLTLIQVDHTTHTVYKNNSWFFLFILEGSF